MSEVLLHGDKQSTDKPTYYLHVLWLDSEGGVLAVALGCLEHDTGKLFSDPTNVKDQYQDIVEQCLNSLGGPRHKTFAARGLGCPRCCPKGGGIQHHRILVYGDFSMVWSQKACKGYTIL